MAVISCRWDWCRSSFPTVDALDNHVKYEHIWPMKPMRKTEIALMRRMDLQSLHSLPNTQSSIFSRGVSPSKPTPPSVPPAATPPTHPRPEGDGFETFTQLSSPPPSHSPKVLPVSPAFDGLVTQVSAAIEIFGRTHGHKTSQSPNRPSSGCSQETVEQHLTEEDDLDSQPPENDVVDTELRWPTDEESNILAFEDIQSEQPVSKEGTATRGQAFRCGSLSVPLSIQNQTSSDDLEGSDNQSQPLVLQSQAPYSSQALGWSQTP